MDATPLRSWITRVQNLAQAAQARRRWSWHEKRLPFHDTAHYHLTMAEDADMDTADVLAIAASIATLGVVSERALTSILTFASYEAGEQLFCVGHPGEHEFFVLNGILRTFVYDSQGNEITFGFHVAPSVMPPSIVRVSNGVSRVECRALTDTRVARFEYSDLVPIMQTRDDMQRWGDEVLRQELASRADREWALATLTGPERLAQFRSLFPDLEDRVPHDMIASYLGMTPASLNSTRDQMR